MSKAKKKSRESEGKVFDSSKLHGAKDAAHVLKYLAREGVDPGHLHEGDTPLHAYVKRQKMGCLMAFLIHAEYDVNMVNSGGDSALHLACKIGDLPSARALIVFDADINGFTFFNETPLDLARRNSPELAEMLIGIGAELAVDVMADLQEFGSQCHPIGVTGAAGGSEDEQYDGGEGEYSAGSEGGKAEEATQNEERKQDKGALDEDKDKLSSIPEDEDYLHMRTPDCGVEMGITSFFIKSSITSATSGVSEAGILRNNPFFPKIDEDSATDHFPPIDTKLGVKIRRSPQTQSPSRSPLSRSPQSRSPVRSSSPHQGSPSTRRRSLSPVSRSRSPSPLSKATSAIGNVPNEQLSGGEEWVTASVEEEKGSEEVMDPAERAQLEELKKNYAMLYPVKDTSVANEEGKEEVEGNKVDDDSKETASGKGEEGKGEADRDELQSSIKEELMKHQGFVNYTQGEFFERLDKHTQELLEKGIENSLGDEGYAAWLQYREIQRFKRDRRALETEGVDFSGDKKENEEPKNWVLVDSEPSRPSILKDSLVPRPTAKQQKRVHMNVPSPPSKSGDQAPAKPPRQRRRQQNPESSVMKSISSLNPNMSVMESVLGKSVIPLRRRRKKAPGRGHRILCLDGGGIKGLVQMEVLRNIEQIAGAPISELFDWIVGTSTGGIVALGSVYAKLTLKDLRRIYFEMKEVVFKSQSKVLTSAANTEMLEAVLKKHVTEKYKMGDVKKPKVLVTAVNKATSDLPLVFFNNCFDDEYSTQEVWKVARYTSAAPVIFKECDNFVDGGVIANNPCNFALTHILQYLKKLKKQQKERGEKPTVSTDIACLVSVGCGIFPAEPIGNADIIDAIRVTRLNKLASKIKDTVNMLTTALTKSEDQANMCRVFCEELEIPFYRFSPQVGEMIGTAETDDLKLCESIISTKKMLFENQDHLEELRQHLGRRTTS